MKIKRLKNFSGSREDFFKATVRTLPKTLNNLGHEWPAFDKESDEMFYGFVRCLNCSLYVYIDFEADDLSGPGSKTKCPFPEPNIKAHLYSEYEEVGFMEGLLIVSEA